MSSILTNNSAMVALQTLKGINSNLQQTQSEISTGKSVANAKDNSAVWAISKVMESDVKGFKGISESLALGESTIAVARQASESVTDLLTDIKGKIVAAQESNVDRTKIQTDIAALTDQITSVVEAAQFNGLNLVDGSISGFNSDGDVGIDILSSLNRDSSGGVAISNIGVDASNLSMTAGTDLSGAGTIGTRTDPGTANVIDANDGGTNDNIEITGFTFLTAAGGFNGTTALKASDAGVDTGVATGLVEGDTLSMTVGNASGNYSVRAGDTMESVVAGLKGALQSAGISDTDFTIDIDTDAQVLAITNNTNADVAFELTATRGTGGLADLSGIDVTTDAGAQTALGQIEGLIQNSIDAAAGFGSAQGRIAIQSDFISQLSDSLKSGIGSLVDADMEETSARLQALQVQQQLGVQSLSIANQAPQSILSLFR